MPVYLIHGFRWPRGGVPSVRVYIVLEDLEDAAAEYIQESATTQVLLESFNNNHPDLMAHLPNLQFIEQYDPEDISDAAVSQPYAYVASRAVTLPDKARPKGGLSERIDERRTESLRPSAEQLKALEQLRDHIAPGQEIGCWIVYNGDPDRDYPQMGKESHITADEPERAELGARKLKTSKSTEAMRKLFGKKP